MIKKLIAAELAVFTLTVIAAIPLRIYELFHLVDQSTGFFSVKSPLEAALNVLLLVSTILALLFYFVKGTKKPAGAFNGIAGATVSAVLAVCFIAAFVSDFGAGMAAVNGGDLVIALTEIFTAAYFGAAAFCGFTGKKLNLAVPALFPIAWGVAVLVISYMNYTVTVNISKYLYDVLKMVFVLLFFYYDSVQISGVEMKKRGSGQFAFGLPAAVFCLMTAVPDIFAAFSGKGAVTVKDILYLAAAVYVLFAIGRVVSANFRREGGRTVFEWQPTDNS